MSDFDKKLDYISGVLEKTTETVSKGVNRILDEVPEDVKETVRKERSKAELRSQIGTHQRTIDKTMAKLGQDRYECIVNNVKSTKEEDLIEIINTNKKVQGLLEEKLKELN